ncbi:hypothetical protein VOLCADRAFT_86349 [Volvox carteri f. nagariensis]|uniref:MaoC-like domain-containing protein n=1 Tax=Volvox carteri f. nagariensis TaxID=3068 RepID=D8TIJ2_VOLCA|nr:uncharacterized protein VOLCADRAFT_86349 [Volvox carteri f. nagariensis]EFJ52900.1 hypothetical protein VOLCADRAFT_86349 [Volvox carteri f. nagariensis]|eukprot:XP_002945905.1 hypothetical protein VOLCADRAFT_86349 [Volvox carteri f. nagariensis]
MPHISLPLVALLAGLFLTAPLAFLLLRPRGRTLVLSSWPHPIWLYIQAFAAVTKMSNKRKEAPACGKPVQVMLDHGVHFSPGRLRRYLALAGFSGGTAGDVPLMYPLVEGFRLFMQALLLPAFPFNVLGSVLAGTRVVALRRIGVDEKLLYSCRVDPAFRTTAKGHTEVDVVVEAHSVRGDKKRSPQAAGTEGAEASGAGVGGGAGGGSEAQLVWRSVTTVIILSPRRKGAKREQQQQPPEAATATSASGKLGPDAGRRYGLLNGDLNPIHLHPATSALFGFKRPIAHALFLTGRAEASLRKAGLELHYPCALTAEFKRPTLLPATLHCAWLGGASGLTAAASGLGAAELDSREGVRFVALSSDLSKEVLVGRAPPIAAATSLATITT